VSNLEKAAQAVLDRWDSPKWEWHQGPTAALMADLRAALLERAQKLSEQNNSPNLSTSELQKVALAVLDEWFTDAGSVRMASLMMKLENALALQHTHADGCWSWGPAHYACACAEIAKLRGWHAQSGQDQAQ